MAQKVLVRGVQESPCTVSIVMLIRHACPDLLHLEPVVPDDGNLEDESSGSSQHISELPMVKNGQGTTLYEHGATLRYLARKYAPELLPDDLQLQARIDTALARRAELLLPAFTRLQHSVRKPDPFGFRLQRAHRLLYTALGVLADEFPSEATFCHGGQSPCVADMSIAPLIFAIEKFPAFRLAAHWQRYLDRFRAAVPCADMCMAPLVSMVLHHIASAGNLQVPDAAAGGPAGEAAGPALSTPPKAAAPTTTVSPRDSQGGGTAAWAPPGAAPAAAGRGSSQRRPEGYPESVLRAIAIPDVCVQQSAAGPAMLVTPQAMPRMAVAMAVGSTQCCVVERKYGQRAEYLTDSLAVSPGQPVIVIPTGGGRDIGVVGSLRPAPTRGSPSGRVLRAATPDEVATWQTTLHAMEQEARQFIRDLCSRHRVPITVHHAYWRFDCEHLTFHYTSDRTHPNFRRLLYEGYRRFKCRIWMNNCQPTGRAPGELVDPTHPGFPAELTAAAPGEGSAT
eukprot:TRINITY_DN14898_c0_g1_i1.p1 TRINITY_DN14898_c0_g1~~TRINITY_DN14898_c0_g1_i1.p1  ORF type:complete len:534 (+),score=93.79 TRINITY_DN14898_c0_g1_i1:79-1602(+)